MKSALKRITLIATCIAGITLPLKFLLVLEVGLINTSCRAMHRGMEVSGKVVFYRGGQGPRAILIGTAEYRQATGERTFSSEKVLARLKLGKIQHSEVIWRVDWIGLSTSFLGLWVCVALFHCWLKSPEPQPGPSPGDPGFGRKG